jgi:glutamine amidotransferase/cyclase
LTPTSGNAVQEERPNDHTPGLRCGQRPQRHQRIESLGETVQLVETPEDILSAEKLVFPGVGAFGSMMEILNRKAFVAPLKAYLDAGRPFLGICLGLHALFEGSAEAPGAEGLGYLKGTVKRFDVDRAVPHIGWNGLTIRQPSRLFRELRGDEKFYFVHSYHVAPEDPDVVLTTTDYGYSFVSAIQKGAIVATQFHPEKSGRNGLKLLENFITAEAPSAPVVKSGSNAPAWPNASSPAWTCAPTTAVTWW